jgi:osmotically-inducible protein OsmY
MFNRSNEPRHRFDERQDYQDSPEYAVDPRRRYGRNDYGDGWSDEPRWSDEAGRGGYRRDQPRREEWNPGMHSERLGEQDVRSRTWSAGDRSLYWRDRGSSRFMRDAGPHAGKGPKGYVRSDERIREEISDELMAAGDLDASEIEVRVSSGEVTLSGSVDSREAKRRAEELIEGVQGVRDVQNLLRVQTNGTGGSTREMSSAGSAAARATRGAAR